MDNYLLKILEKGSQHNAILSSTACSVDPQGSQYFKCDGTWAGINSQSFNQWFNISYIPQLNNLTRYRYKVSNLLVIFKTYRAYKLMGSLCTWAGIGLFRYIKILTSIRGF
jgi:hypothetical protein